MKDVQVEVNREEKKINFIRTGFNDWRAGLTGPIKCLNGFKARVRILKTIKNSWRDIYVALVESEKAAEFCILEP